MNVPAGLNLDMQVTHAPSSGLSRRASGSPQGGRSWLAWGSGIRLGRGRCSLAPPPSNSHEWTEDPGLGLVATTQQLPGLGKGYLEGCEMPQGKHTARKLIRSTQVSPKPGDHRLEHPQLGCTTGQSQPRLAVWPQLGPMWPPNKAVPHVFIVWK